MHRTPGESLDAEEIEMSKYCLIEQPAFEEDGT